VQVQLRAGEENKHRKYSLHLSSAETPGETSGQTAFSRLSLIY